MKLSGHSPIDMIVNHRKFIEKVFMLLVMLSLICFPFVGINYDLTEYLPDYAPSSKAIDIMEKEFTYPGMARVMLTDVTLYEAKAYKDRIEDVDGVDMVVWCDTKQNIMGSSQFLQYSDLKDYYKDGCAYMDITFLEKDSSSQTHKAVNAIKKIVADKGMVAGSAASDTMLGPTINSQVAHVMIMAIITIYIVLTLTTTSWFEPILFLMVMGIAILINNGTNIFMGTISFLTNAVSSVLQLAVSMDYSIFLLHTFTREKANGTQPEQAMANALRSCLLSVVSSGATTIAGFLALALMEFSIGRDMGFVLAKGVVISLLTVLLLMPSLILRFQDKIDKNAHRPFIPSFRKFGEGVYKIRIPIFALIAILILPCYVGQNMIDFSYGNESVSNSPGTQVYADAIKIDAKFGQSNMMLAMVPVGDNVREKRLSDAIEELPYVKYATSLSNSLPEGVPEEFVPKSITKQLHSEHWARILISVSSSGESDAAFTYANKIRSILQQHYPNQQIYLVGTTPSTQDIHDIITQDYSRVNIISLLGVAVVVGIAFKSFVLPIVVLIPIEAAVFINMAVPYIAGDRIMFLGYIIVSCVQLGATIDYSILLTNNYLDARAQADKKEAAIRAVTSSALSILTSGSILAVVGYGLIFMSSVEAIASLGHMIGRGGLLSVALVLLLLPICLIAFDRFIIKQDYAKKKHERMNRIREHTLILPQVSELQAQAHQLHLQIRENRKARRQRFMNRLRGIKAKASRKDSQPPSGNPETALPPQEEQTRGNLENTKNQTTGPELIPTHGEIKEAEKDEASRQEESYDAKL